MIPSVFLMIAQSDSRFQFFQKIADWFKNIDPIVATAWTLIVLAFVFFIMLLLFTEYKREERDSVKFTSIILILFSLCAGFGVHLLLISGGQ